MRAADELRSPVAHDSRWLLLALLALAVVALYYLAVLWWTRPRRPARARRTRPEPWVDRLREIESGVASGRLTARAGHQEISRTVREFVAERSGIPAATMTLSDLQDLGPERLTDLVALVYPPSFSPDEQLPDALFDEAATRARSLVTTWT